MKKFYLLIFTCTFYLACQKNSESLPEEIIIPLPSPEYITTSVQGIVSDDKGAPVAGANISFGSKAIITDNKGLFRFDSVDVDKYSSTIKVEKSGYFEGYRTFSPNPEILNYVRVQLIAKMQSGKFSNATGGSIDIANGGTVTFTAGAVVKLSNSSAYVGDVTVYATSINPSSKNARDIIVGDHRGITKMGGHTGLQSWGLVTIELEGSTGEKLQLASGKPATLSLPIPSELTGTAPSVIPMYWFDKTLGLWKEEGSSKRNGNNYVGLVTHFSSWGSFQGYPIVAFEAEFKIQAGGPLFDARVEILDDKQVGHFYGRTDSTGKAGGWIPLGKMLTMNVYNQCNELVHTQKIGPVIDDTKLDPITVNIPETDVLTLSGVVVDCNGIRVKNGYVNMYYNNYYYNSHISDGKFSFKLYKCVVESTTASLYIVDIDAAKTAQVSRMVINGNTNLGSFTSCAISTSEFFNINLNGTNYHVTQENGGSFACSMEQATPGVYMLSADNSTFSFGAGIYASSVNTNAQPYDFTCKVKNPFTQYEIWYPITIPITELGEEGGYLAGTFNGTYPDSQGGIIPISGDFRFKVGKK